jgi:hypothetical protein
MVDLLPWSPSVDEVPTAYDSLIKEGRAPVPETDPDWTRSKLEAFVPNLPEAVEPLWEMLLGLWRLRTVEKEDSATSTWERLVSQWMVRPPFVSSGAFANWE